MELIFSPLRKKCLQINFKLKLHKLTKTWYTLFFFKCSFINWAGALIFKLQGTIYNLVKFTFPLKLSNLLKNKQNQKRPKNRIKQPKRTRNQCKFFLMRDIFLYDSISVYFKQPLCGIGNSLYLMFP